MPISIKYIGMSIVLTALLTGCGIVERIQDLIPRDHDPVLVSGYINLQVSLDDVSCDNKKTILVSKQYANWLNQYAEFRSDPQRISTKGILDNLSKAYDSNDIMCNHWINLTKSRMDIIKEAWSGR